MDLQEILNMSNNEKKHLLAIDEVQEITVSADKEYKLEKNLEAMKQEWAEIEFDVKAYKETGTSIVGGIDEIIALLDDHIVKTQAGLRVRVRGRVRVRVRAS